MSYVPPHKRHSNEPVRPSPIPNSVLSRFKTGLDLGTRSSSYNNKNRKFIYAEGFVSRLFTVGPNGTQDEIPHSVKLVPVSMDSAEWRAGEKPLVLINSDIGSKRNDLGQTELRTPWFSVAQKVEDDLFLAFERVKNRMQHHAFEGVKLRFIARFGKFLFRGHPSLSLETLKDGPVAESTLQESRKSFYTNVPSSYIKTINYEVVQKMGLLMEQEKDIYYILILDRTRSDATICCKCTLKEGRLDMYKVELTPLKELNVDVFCDDQNLDLRLAVDSKMTSSLTDNEVCAMKELIELASVDPNVKGGLRWPLGKASSRGRYSVYNVWHIISTSYGSPTLKLKVREVD